MRRAQSLLFPLISILLLLIFSTLSYGQAWSGILPPARATDWGQAGIPGGIPSGSWSAVRLNHLERSLDGYDSDCHQQLW